MFKNLAINTRMLLFMTIIGVILTIIFFVLIDLKRKQKNLIIVSAKEQLLHEASSLMTLNSQTIRQVAFDYTYWDDLCFNIYKSDKAWFEDNISSLIPTYHFSHVIVYDTLFNTVHSAPSKNEKVSNIFGKSFFKVLKERRIMHFFKQTSEGLFEVSAASVHPSYDPSHKATKPSGYLVVLKSVDDRYLEKFSSISGSSVYMSKGIGDEDLQENLKISAAIALQDWDGNTVNYLMFFRNLESLKQYSEISFLILGIMFLSFFITLFLFHFAIKYSITKPLKIVSSILATNDQGLIEGLKSAPKEFTQIGSLFQKYLSQKKELIIARDMAEESDRLKTAFLVNISHEIRTPMNGIIGFAELLKQQDISGSEREKYLSVIEESGVRMLNIINDLIDISKIESGHVELSYTESSIDDQLQYIYNFFKIEAEQKGLKLRYCANEQRTILLYTDKEKLYAILTNLVNNAIKYTNSGYVDFGYSIKDNLIEFYVKDTGIGIAEDKKKIIFDRFVQADSSLSKQYEGAGLGLSIAKAYANMLGGDIWVESDAGLGSAFYFILPYKNTGLNQKRT